ncbi:tyrosine-type recombinase/integrase [Amedibacillus sp. YH-ame10]
MGKNLKGREIGKGISQRKDGTYMGRFVDRYKNRQTFYDKDLKMLRRRLEKERHDSEYGLLLNGCNITLADWFDEFVKLYKVGYVKETTIYRIKQTFSPCRSDVIGMMKLCDIRAFHIQRLFNELHEKGYTYGTLNMFKSLLKEMFKKAIGNGFATFNPCESIVLPKKVKYESRYLTEEEQTMFLESAESYQHYDIFCANLSCGARIGELLGLKWGDIDFEHKKIFIQRTLHYARLKDDEVCHFFFTTPKTEDSKRVIPLLSDMEKVLKRVLRKQLAIKALHASQWKQVEPFVDMVFTTQQGVPIRYGDVNRTIKNVVMKANLLEEEIAKLENRDPYYLEPFSPHCFRHTFVTKCKKSGVSYETIKNYVGHSKIEMTAYYDHNKPEMDIDDLNRISFV